MRCASNNCKKKMKSGRWRSPSGRPQLGRQWVLIVGAATTPPLPQPVDTTTHSLSLLAQGLQLYRPPRTRGWGMTSHHPQESYHGTNGACRWGTRCRQEEAAGVNLGWISTHNGGLNSTLGQGAVERASTSFCMCWQPFPVYLCPGSFPPAVPATLVWRAPLLCLLLPEGTPRPL